MELGPHLRSDPAVRGGAPCIADTRISVWVVAARLNDGDTLGVLQEENPHVPAEAFHAAMPTRRPTRVPTSCRRGGGEPRAPAPSARAQAPARRRVLPPPFRSPAGSNQGAAGCRTGLAGEAGGPGLLRVLAALAATVAGCGGKRTMMRAARSRPRRRPLRPRPAIRSVSGSLCELSAAERDESGIRGSCSDFRSSGAA
jgi:uncharacterized protein (DUF433 family)